VPNPVLAMESIVVNTQLIGLSAFLVRDGGLNSDFMLAQYTVASLVSENRALSHPAFIRLRRKPRSWPWGNAFMCDIPFQQSIYHASVDFAHRRMTHRSPRLREVRYSERRKVGVGGYGFGDHGLARGAPLISRFFFSRPATMRSTAS
jgi:hypothetical protein